MESLVGGISVENISMSEMQCGSLEMLWAVGIGGRVPVAKR